MECAEASLAYLEAYTDGKQPEHLRDALTILRTIARHHIDGAKAGDIKYTEPFLINQHIAEPTLYYLENRLR